MRTVFVCGRRNIPTSSADAPRNAAIEHLPFAHGGSTLALVLNLQFIHHLVQKKSASYGVPSRCIQATLAFFIHLLTTRTVFPPVYPYPRLQQLEPLKLAIQDESDGEESKFAINIVSNSFEGMTLLKRHRSVYGLMADEMKIVHAVSLDTKTPEEAGM